MLIYCRQRRHRLKHPSPQHVGGSAPSLLPRCLIMKEILHSQFLLVLLFFLRFTNASNTTTITTEINNNNNNNNNNNTSQSWSGYTGPEYRKEIFPPQVQGVPLEVGISVLVRNVAKIDEDKGMVLMEVNLRVKWQDTRLTPPPHLLATQYVPLDPAILEGIWVPDLYIDHSSGTKIPTVLTSIASVWVYGDTTVDYSGNMFVELSCRMKYGWFPGDHQICKFSMESYAYTQDRNVYVWVPPGLELSSQIHSEQFLVRFERTDPFTRVQDVYGSYPALSFRIHLTRRLSYMLLQIYLPSGLFVVVSFVSLLVPAEAIPGRMTLCITTILTMSALLGVAMQSTPRVSYVRAIDVWLLSCLSFVSIVLLEFGAVIKLLEMEKNAKDVPSSARVTNIMIKATTAQDSLQKEVKSSGWVPGATSRLSMPSSKQVDKVCLILLPSCFFIFNLAYWGWFLTGSQQAIPTLKNNGTVEPS